MSSFPTAEGIQIPSFLSCGSQQVGFTWLLQGIMSQPSLFSSTYINSLREDTRTIPTENSPM